MPSKEEIVEWLREAALISDYSAMLHTLKPSDKPVKKSVFHNRAAQVSAMRCETCKHHSPVNNNLLWCARWHYPFPPDHGCFSHEQKSIN